MNPVSAIVRHLRRCWHGDVRVSTLLWRDMVVVGSVINLVMSIVALLAAAAAAPLALAVLLHFAPLPYNSFLLAALWRLPRAGTLPRVVGSAWWAAASLL